MAIPRGLAFGSVSERAGHPVDDENRTVTGMGAGCPRDGESVGSLSVEGEVDERWGAEDMEDALVEGKNSPVRSIPRA